MPRVLREHGESVNGPGAKGYCCVLPLLLARYSACTCAIVATAVTRAPSNCTEDEPCF